MLSARQSQQVITQRYMDTAPVTMARINLPNVGLPYRVDAINTSITSAAVVVLPALIFLDENLNTVTGASIIPWLFPNTTINSTVTQSPDVSLAGLFGPALGGFIVSGLHVFDGWFMQWGNFVGTPGVIFDGVITFSAGFN